MLNDKRHIHDSLTNFARDVIKQARNNLTRQKKKASSSLYKSLDYKLNVSKNSFELKFLANDYADFVNSGVHGSQRPQPGAKYKFGSGSFKGKTGEGGAFDSSIRRWIKIKGLKYRDKDGKFKKGGIKSLSYLIRRKIYTQGIRPSLFFTKSFKHQYKSLPEEILEAYALDVEGFIEFTFKNPTQEQYKLDNL